MWENTELRETAKLRLMCLPCLNIYNQGYSSRKPFFKDPDVEIILFSVRRVFFPI